MNPPRPLLFDGNAKQSLGIAREERFSGIALALPCLWRALLDDARIMSIAPCLACQQKGDRAETPDQLTHPPSRSRKLLDTGPNQLWSWESPSSGPPSGPTFIST